MLFLNQSIDLRLRYKSGLTYFFVVTYSFVARKRMAGFQYQCKGKNEKVFSRLVGMIVASIVYYSIEKIF